jgi:hypothetical protein
LRLLRQPDLCLLLGVLLATQTMLCGCGLLELLQRLWELVL